MVHLDTEQKLSILILQFFNIDCFPFGYLPLLFILQIQQSNFFQQCMGVVITASHNPIQDNGLKFINPDGSMFYENQEAQLNDFINQENISIFLDNLQNNGVVLFFRDTRPSSIRLQGLMQEFFNKLGYKFYDFGEQTTPQGFYLVNLINKNQQILETQTVEEIKDNYYQNFSQHFIIYHSIEINLDCSNGVGFESFDKLLQKININTPYFNIKYNNCKIRDQLNNLCGIKLNQEPSMSIKKKSYHKILIVSLMSTVLLLMVMLIDLLCISQIKIMNYKQLTVIDKQFYTLNLQKAQYKKLKKQQRKNLIQFQDFTIGNIQTAYANGGSTIYMKQKLNIDSVYVPTGVKYQYKEALKYDIGVYFESNGHGSIYYNNKCIDIIRQYETQYPQLKLLKSFLQLSNQEAGDSMINLLLAEMQISLIRALQHLNMKIQELMELYTDLPSLNNKVIIKDISLIKTNWNQTRVVQPIEIQEQIDQIISAHCNTRAFIRPSGTEDIVRIYVENPDQDILELISEQIKSVILSNKLIN